jgi:hypothetical protein
MKSGIELIQQERSEQLEKHGYSTEQDARFNKDSQLLSAIMLLSSNIAFIRNDIKMPREAFDDLKPEGWNNELCFKMINKPVIEQLQIIGALAAAEIDRMMLPVKEE